MAGLSDIHHDLCLGLALWNGVDPILKERMFGLTGPQGNHGEDVKDYWWYLDALPSHAWLRWRYHYPQAAFPYQRLVEENARRSRDEPEFELLDTGVFDDNRYWSVDVAYAKASPTEVLARITIENHGPEEATLSVLPTLWFRNTWRVSGDDAAVAVPGRRRHRRRAPAAGRVPAGRRPDRRRRRGPRRCSATTRRTPPGCSGRPRSRAYPKDGINDHVVSGAATVNPDRRGTKAAWRYRLTVPAGGTAELRLRLHRPDPATSAVRRPTGHGRRTSTTSMTAREREADEFYAAIAPADTDAGADAGAAPGLRRAGLEQADVPVPGEPVAGRRPRPAGTARRAPAPAATPAGGTWTPSTCWPCPTRGSTRGSPPGTWRSTRSRWAHLDPAFAKYQLLVLLREWFQHPNGALPAYEWNFDDVNPPVHALAAIRVFVIDGGTDFDFLERVFQKLLLNFTWWLNRQDPDGNNLFGGGFLGLGQHQPDRPVPPAAGDSAGAGRRHRVDGVLLGRHADRWRSPWPNANPVYEDMVVKFLEQTVLIMDALEDSGCYDPDDGFFYDLLTDPPGPASRSGCRPWSG